MDQQDRIARGIALVEKGKLQPVMLERGKSGGVEMQDRLHRQTNRALRMPLTYCSFSISQASFDNPSMKIDLANLIKSYVDDA